MLGKIMKQLLSFIILFIGTLLLHITIEDISVIQYIAMFSIMISGFLFARN
ncbi:hypothetical protein [Bacillus pinisoli]|uniref:hypothetical protein n=1 Tax=Bacillus pinisoli TaxID=2901866 RepID=UPI001FF64E5D|nr:hypothetical protein [Bacillus pinisoli]